MSRELDVAHYLRLLAHLHGLALLILCADLATDWHWDFIIPDTFAALTSLAEQGCIDTILGRPLQGIVLKLLLR